jgi:hypothetical protein
VFRFEPFESTSDAIRRLATEEVDGALEWLGGADRPFDVRIHETRKHLKRLRALLVLAAAAIVPEAQREEMRAARAAAAALAEIRGKAALRIAFDDLNQRNPSLFAPDALAHVHRALGAGTGPASDPEAPVAEAMAILTRAQARVNKLQLVPDLSGWNCLEPGFRDTYRRARRAYLRAREAPSPARLHAFRTPQKRHFYQVELLERAWEAPLRAQRQELSRLGDLLGEHHDLSLLRGELAGPELETEWEALREPLERRLAKLERAAFELAAHAFAEKPGAITRRFGAYFRASLES